MSLDVTNLAPEENMMAYIDMNYEDGQKVVMYQNGSGKKSPSATPVNAGNGKSGVISNNESHFVHSMDSLVSAGSNQKPQVGNVTIGPFQFNICSYKQDGRKFRMVIYIYSPDTTNILAVGNSGNGPQLCCCLISPSFTIRAKKPIVKPGIKGKKGDEGVEDKKDKKKHGKKNGKRKADGMSDDEDSEHEDSNDAQQENVQELVDIDDQIHKRQRMDNHEQENMSTENSFQQQLPPPHLQQSQIMPQAPLKKRMAAGKSPMKTVAPSENSEYSLSFLQLADENQTPQFMDKDDLNNTMNTLPSQPSHQQTQGESRKSNESSSSGINAGQEKVFAIVQTFQQMSDTNRKQLLCQLIELSMPHEKEFIYRKYFNADGSGPESYQSSNSANPSNTIQPTVPFMNNYMSAYQYQMIRQQQQELLDYFASMQQQEDFAQQQQMQNQMFQQMMQNNTNAQTQPTSSNASGNTTPVPPVFIPPGVISGQTSDVDQFFVELFDS
jgi:hypothetical protein